MGTLHSEARLPRSIHLYSVVLLNLSHDQLHLGSIQPAAAGSGIQDIIGFLNGTRIKDIFKLQTCIVKFLSCSFAVGCGMPVGNEGPMIHLGSIVAVGVSQFKSVIFECTQPILRFRYSEDGIASAFGAPVGGLLFAMEEVSAFWKNKLSWQVFFCCMVATFTTYLLNSSFTVNTKWLI